MTISSTPPTDPAPPPGFDPPTSAMDPGEVSVLFAAIAAQTVDRQETPRDRLREWPTPLRVALSVGTVSLAGAAYVGLTGLRGDLAGAEWFAFTALGVLAATLAVGAAGLALRGLHARPLPQVPAIAAMLVVGPLALTVLPWPGPADPVPVAAHVGCALGSLAIGGLLAALIRVLDREDRPSRWRLVAAAAAGGLTAFVVQGLHCASTAPLHLIASHGTTGLLLAGALLAARRLRAT